MRFFEIIRKFVEENPNGVLGGLCGVFFGLLIISFGILKTLIFILSCIIGFLVGKRL